VRDVRVESQLKALRVDHDELHLVGPGLVKDRDDERVQADGLAGAGRAGDEQVRHAREVGRVVDAVDGLAEGERELRLRLAELPRLQDLAHEDGLALGVRHLDADVRLAGQAVDAD
jgi:hypothetical protein